MLPTAGFFQELECPYYQTGCSRPYCHFKHRKRGAEDSGLAAAAAVLPAPKSINDAESDPDVVIVLPSATAPEVPTYKPTPKSELAIIQNGRHHNHHIPISYVPDFAFSNRRNRPFVPTSKVITSKVTYNPTPLSILSNANKLRQFDDLNSTRSSINDDDDGSGGSNSNTFSTAYCARQQQEYASQLAGEDDDDDDDDDADDEEADNDANAGIDLENLDEEFDLIDSIIQTQDDLPKAAAVDLGYKAGFVDDDIVIIEPESRTDVAAQKLVIHTDNDEIKQTKDKSSDLTKKHDRERRSSSSSSRKKSGHRSHHGHKSHHSHHKSKHKDSSKNICGNSQHKSSADASSSGSNKKSHHHTTSSSSSTKHKEKKNGSNGSSTGRHSSSSQKSGSSSSKRSHHKSSSLSSSSSHSKSKTSEEHCVSKKRRKTEQNGNDEKQADDVVMAKTSATVIPNQEKRKSGFETSVAQNVADIDDSLISVPDDLDISFDDENEDQTFLECYKIFNEYKPETNFAPPPAPSATISTDNEEECLAVAAKKRIAHAGANVPLINHTKPVTKTAPINPGFVMANRLKVAAQQHQSKMLAADLSASLMPSLPAPAAPSLLEAAKQYNMLKSMTAVTAASNTTKKLAKKVIPPVRNVSFMQAAKARIAELTRHRNGTNSTASATFEKPPTATAAVAALLSSTKSPETMSTTSTANATTTVAVATTSSTIAQTSKASGGKRQAHVPRAVLESNDSLADIPDVLQAHQSKLPVNVRSRFLTSIAEECLKLYYKREDAFTRALNEEFQCYEKCKVLVTYKNSAMLAVNRLRKENVQRASSGEGKYRNIDKATMGVKQRASRLDEEMTGERFYQNAKRYVLSEEELDLHGYPKEGSLPGRATIKRSRNAVATAALRLSENQRKCCRCSKVYSVDALGFAMRTEECIYHRLKKRTLRGEQTYLCCKSSNDDLGCCTAATHVCEEVVGEGVELEGFQCTMQSEGRSDVRNYAVYALDCEMCYTVKGLELTRVTVIDSQCKTVYETLVKPLNPIIDYNTTFSGITAKQLERTATTILQVQANILHLCNADTILIGHSLESDLKALKIVHRTVIDTSILFPHRMGLPHKRALRVLASEHLNKIIQNEVEGHDSAEDAITCMELVRWKLREELKGRFLK